MNIMYSVEHMEYIAYRLDCAAVDLNTLSSEINTTMAETRDVSESAISSAYEYCILKMNADMIKFSELLKDMSSTIKDMIDIKEIPKGPLDLMKNLEGK